MTSRTCVVCEGPVRAPPFPGREPFCRRCIQVGIPLLWRMAAERAANARISRWPGRVIATAVVLVAAAILSFPVWGA